MSMKLVVVATLSLISSLALADSMGPQGDKFYEEAAHFANACSEEPCKAPYSTDVLYNQKNRTNKLAQDTRETLKKVAWEQAQVWGDTILEGDYTSAGRTRLDSVQGFYKENRLVGYKITYSEKAWYTGECNYEGTRESLKGCKEGRITEVSFVSPDMKTFFTDEDRHADFDSNTVL